MGKTVSLKGPAAKAFLGLTGLPGAQPKTEDERIMQVATSIYLAMKTDDHSRAIEILKAFRSSSEPR